MILQIDQGKTTDYQWPITDDANAPVSLSGYTARAQVRPHPDSATVRYEWSTTNGGIVLATGLLTLKTPPATSAAWSWRSGVFDIELTAPDGAVTSVANGVVVVMPEVTR